MAEVALEGNRMALQGAWAMMGAWRLVEVGIVKLQEAREMAGARMVAVALVTVQNDTATSALVPRPLTQAAYSAIPSPSSLIKATATSALALAITQGSCSLILSTSNLTQVPIITQAPCSTRRTPPATCTLTLAPIITQAPCISVLCRMLA